MTPLEIVDLIRMLIDDSREWFVDAGFINNAINDAILLIVRQKYMEGDERLLRPLYRRGYGASGVNMINGEKILDSNGDDAKVLYPRSCRIFTSGSETEGKSPSSRAMTTVAKYMDSARYFNFVESTLSGGGFTQAYPGDIFPRAGYYTIQKEDGYKLHFVNNNSNELANIWYIKYPQEFEYIDNDAAHSVGIELPSEYHPHVAMEAAERINDIDVEEMERGDIAYQNQRINIQDSAL